tara:strand:- start:2344 stop:2802 length:459 start_codon:yes stop_codon:yes gene_type:complete
MNKRLRLLAGACLILLAFFWNNLGAIIPTIPDDSEKIIIEKPETAMIEEWQNVSNSITDSADILRLCIFNKVFADRVKDYDASAQQINDVYVDAAKSCFGDTIKGKYELLGPATEGAMASVLGDENHQTTDFERLTLSKKFMAFAWSLNNKL